MFQSSAFNVLWEQFMIRSSALLKETVGEDKDLELIVWSSNLTRSEHMESLPNDYYTVQVSADGLPQIKTLAEKGYNMIFSNPISNLKDRFCKGYEGTPSD